MEKQQERVAFCTLGCKVNQNETELMEAMFLQAGFQVTSFEQPADVYVINTCTVTHISDQKSRQMIRRAKNIQADAIVVVTGCYAQVAPEDIAKIEDVDIILGTNKRHEIIERVREFQQNRKRQQTVLPKDELFEFEEIDISREIHHTRAYLKVQDGCEQFCTYCIIPYARGPLRSREMENCLAEAKRLEQAGFQELILTGIHLGAYGKEHGRYTLADLCEKILKETKIARIRLSSLEPTEVSDHLLQLMIDSPRMCRHLHLPLQAGTDSVLERMNRPYRTDDYRREISKIREAVEDIAISTDLMVGFPGETDEDFADSLAFCDEMQFSSMHIFKYSPRTGTPAADYPNQVKHEVKNLRSGQMQEMANKNAHAYLTKHIGEKVEVLVEEQDKNGNWLGHTDNYLKVCFAGTAEKNTFVRVELEKVKGNMLLGKKL